MGTDVESVGLESAGLIEWSNETTPEPTEHSSELSMNTLSERPEKCIDSSLKQAEELEALLPSIVRRLFPINPSHPSSDLTPIQFRICSILFRGHRTMVSLCTELRISTSSLSQISDRLDHAGLIDRAILPLDRRTKGIQLSKHGLNVMECRRLIRVERVRAALQVLNEKERIALIAILETVVKELEEPGTSD